VPTSHRIKIIVAQDINLLLMVKELLSKDHRLTGQNL
jgi:hypothetical protein